MHPRFRMTRRIAVAALFAAAAAGCLARPVTRLAVRAAESARAQADWAAARGHPRAAVVAGDPACWLRIPSVQLSTPVLAGTGESVLHRGPALAWDGPMPAVDPARAGFLCILGHRDTHFRKLAGLRPGARVEIESRDGTRRRQVVAEIEIVSPDEVPDRLRRRAEPDTIVLLTCHPFRHAGPAPGRILFWTRPEAPEK